MREFLRIADSGGSRSRGGSRLDFSGFVKAFAWIFYRGGGAGDEDMDDDVDDSSGGETDDVARGRDKSNPARRERGRRRTPTDTSRDAGARGRSEQRPRKLGYGSIDRGGSRDRSRSRGRGRSRGQSHGVADDGVGIGEEAELRRWEKRLGEKQMRRLERVFNEWAVDAGDGGGGGGATVEVRDLERCFKELGKDDMHRRELQAWCDEVDLAPGDALSLADFAYAYHSMFVDAGREGVRVCSGCTGKKALCP